ncbi:MAG: diaminopimelate epimerase [Actinomycetota bacterium]
MTDELRFAKYQGSGNDFVMLVDLDDVCPLEPDLVAVVCDRRTGVGADGVIRLVRSERADASFVMDYRNADGSVAEMCGNGARCVGKLVHDLGLSDEPEFGIETRGGVRRLRLHDGGGDVHRVTVEMGVPGFTRASIPMRGPAWETFLGQPFDVGGGITLTASAVSMGNPHLVLFVEDDPDRFHVGHIGPALEHHESFPEGTNVEFAQVQPDAIKARVWERGSGETMACGSGACAIAVAANEAGLVPNRTVVRFPGGALEVERLESGEVLLTGEAERVFEGVVDLDRLRGRVRA